MSDTGTFRIGQHPILGKQPRQPGFSFEYDGITVTALPGDTVAAALMAAGITDFHVHPSGRRRGIFCGIGQCSDCLVQIDGIPGVRACITRVLPGMQVRSQPDGSFGAVPILPPVTEAGLAQPALEHFECVVVGAGPAGLGAAIESAAAGLRTVLFDENDEPGGQLFKQIHKFFGSQRHKAGVRGYEIGRQLMGEAESAGVQFRLGQPVWGAFPDQRLAVKGRSRSYQVQYDYLVLATGATENPLSFPGWTLPGVMTAGAAQTMVNIRRVLPGRRVVMVGGGNVGLIVAYQIMQAGGTIAALVEASPHIGGYRVHLNKLLRAGVPVYTGHTILAAESHSDMEQTDSDSHSDMERLSDLQPSDLQPTDLQPSDLQPSDLQPSDLQPSDRHQTDPRRTDRVASVLLGRTDGSDAFRVQADSVCVAVGLSPRLDLAALTGAKLASLPALGGWLPLHGPEMEAGETVFVAGDLTGIEEAGTALDEGRIAGLAVAKRSGRLPAGQAEARIQQLRQSLAMLRIGRNGPARQAGKAEIEKYYARIKAGTL